MQIMSGNTKCKMAYFQGGSRLPAEFQEVEYIESSGTQYIDTGYALKITDCVNIKLSPSDFANDIAYFGAYQAGGGKFCELGQLNHYFRFNISSTSDDVSIIINQIYELELRSDGEWYYNNQKVLHQQKFAIDMSISAYLFATNHNGPIKYGNMRLYSCQFYDNNILVRDFVPCYRKADNKIGLYDLVNGVFYTNAGTGTFLKGNNVQSAVPMTMKIEMYKKSRLPNTFQEVEYIESSGTQYIDTGILTSNNIKVKCVAINTFGLIVGPNLYGGSLFGGRTSSSNSNYSFTTGGSQDYIGNGNGFLTINKNVNTDKIYLEYDNTSISYVCGIYNYVNEQLNVQILQSYNLYIFAINQAGTPYSQGTFKLFEFELYNNGVLVRNFVPCYRKADNEIGLYDLVNRIFYTNAGSGTFTKGGDVL